ncbi:SDR family NAD(P)-dependent oxidoreductase [Amycolatopsis anabasis]|uniref:SDR family NAD(P)-dependent oxidoreductase n=1 Tax=Amycolatopsis anabasis TaxID=1840409 RepID=UPI00131B188A|nr:SDR family NAD(P)-dependent oxidoreductase [Amycolatopsis anabasis]
MTRHDSSRVWLVTGAGRGFGRRFAEAALAAGDRVVGTARRPEALDDLVAAHDGRLAVLPLDVADRAAVFATVERAIEAFGRLDIVVNNAGYGLMGAVEEITEEQARAQLDTNFFGALWVTQAVLPQLRKQGSGHIVQISSVGGLGAIATMGLYAAGKWALEGMSEALAQEVEPFGIKVTLVEPGGYATDWGTTSMRMAEYSPAYEPVRAKLFAEGADIEEGDPAKVAEAVLKLVDSENPPLRLLLGDAMYDGIFEMYEKRIQEWRSWENLGRAC